jgi:hypothetical protein
MAAAKLERRRLAPDGFTAGGGGADTSPIVGSGPAVDRLLLPTLVLLDAPFPLFPAPA